MNKTWPLTLILGGLAMIGPFSIDTYLPSFPAIAQEFSVDPILVQQTLSVYLFAFAFMMLFYGTLSDSFGRRPVILGALLLYSVASLGAVFAPSLAWLVAFRALQGLSAGAGMVVGRAMVRDRVSGADAQRMLSQIVMVFGIAPAIAPIFGGWLHVVFGWRSVFVFLTFIGVSMFVVCYRALPESLPTLARQAFNFANIATNYCKAFRHPQFILLSLAIGFAFSAFGLYIAAAADFMIVVLHLPETAFGWLFIPLVSGMMLGAALSGRSAGKVLPRAMIANGYSLMIIAAAWNIAYNLFFVAAVPWAVLPLMLYTFGLALIMPNMTLLGLDLFPKTAGLAASLQSFIQTMVFSLVAGLVAPLLFGSALKMAIGTSVGLVLSLICWALANRRTLNMQPQKEDRNVS